MLNSNPDITGVYKDRGGVFYAKYRMDDAWTCWDVARKICPSHPILKDVLEHEKRLEKTHPDFFL